MFRRISAGLTVPAPENTLPSRQTAIDVPDAHYVNGNPLVGPFPDHLESMLFGMDCFWGAEGLFWQQDGVYTTAAIYAGGTTPNPTYEETCTGMTGHAEAVLVVFDPAVVELDQLFKIFWENHDPTQYMGQGNDIGTQYRSAIYTITDAQLVAATASRDAYQAELTNSGFGDITTEIAPSGGFYYGEDFHQQYLAKNPAGYCNHGFCQVPFQPGSA